MAKFSNNDGWDLTAGHTPRCYESHPALSLGVAEIYGGSCSNPFVKDADIYIGFDGSMIRTRKQYPWEEGTEFLYRIVDMAAPEDIVSFTKLLNWMMTQLVNGKKMHCGCIGGHGRTGTVLAALTKLMLDENDAITYVRENYCKKAVESEAQVRFLSKHFGIKEVAGAKIHIPNETGWTSLKGGATKHDKWSDPSYYQPKLKEAHKTSYASDTGSKGIYRIAPARNDATSMWGKETKFDKPVIGDRIPV